MPKFKVTTPDGKVVFVNAPRGASGEDAAAYVKELERIKQQAQIDQYGQGLVNQGSDSVSPLVQPATGEQLSSEMQKSTVEIFGLCLIGLIFGLIARRAVRGASSGSTPSRFRRWASFWIVFPVSAGVSGVLIGAHWSDDRQIMLGLFNLLFWSPIILGIVYIIDRALSYKPANHANTESVVGDSGDPYDIAGREILSEKMLPAIWARALDEAGGDVSLAKAIYVRNRVGEIKKVRSEVAQLVEVQGHNKKSESTTEDNRSSILPEILVVLAVVAMTFFIAVYLGHKSPNEATPISPPLTPVPIIRKISELVEPPPLLAEGSDKDIEVIRAGLKSIGAYPWLDESCIDFVKGDSTDVYVGISLVIKNTAGCPYAVGESQFGNKVDEFRVEKNTGNIFWMELSSGGFVPFEQFSAHEALWAGQGGYFSEAEIGRWNYGPDKDGNWGALEIKNIDQGRLEFNLVVQNSAGHSGEIGGNASVEGGVAYFRNDFCVLRIVKRGSDIAVVSNNGCLYYGGFGVRFFGIYSRSSST